MKYVCQFDHLPILYRVQKAVELHKIQMTWRMEDRTWSKAVSNLDACLEALGIS